MYFFLVLFNSSNYRTYCPSKPLFSVCLGAFGDRLPPNSDKNHSPMTHRCKKYKKTVSSHHVITLSRATLYIAYARVYVCIRMLMRIRACARTIIYRRASIRIGIMRSISNPCSMNNDRYRGSCRTVNKVSESIVVLNRNNYTKQTQVQCLC